MVAINDNLSSNSDVKTFSIEEIRSMMKETGIEDFIIDLSITTIKMAVIVEGFCDIFFIRDNDKYVSFNLTKELAITVATILGTSKGYPMIIDVIRVQ